MSSLLTAAKISGANSGQDEKDLEHIEDIEKVLSLVELLKTTYEDFIVELHIDPMSIVKDKLKSVKNFKFYVIYNREFQGEELVALKEECSDFITALMSDEFPDIESISKVEFYSSWLWKTPTLCLYSKLGNPMWEDVSEELKEIIMELCSNMGLGISLSYNSVYSKYKCLYLHFIDATDKILFEGKFKAFKDKFNVEISSTKSKSGTIYYVPIIGQSALKYDIPYLYIDKSSECLTQILNEFEDNNCH